ncbi:MAG: hypothetical protein HPY85_04205 [Anaerolineae bacterium]|nr:hypothetical protein [Anaerolineae bacterium]
MEIRNPNTRKNITRSIFLSIPIGAALLAAGMLMLWTLRPADASIPSTPVITKIAAPSATQTFASAPDNAEAVEGSSTQIVVDGITIGTVVQITGTEGAGLRLRSDAGINHSVQFLGEELELFQVVQGPVDSDGYTWWYLESPYDSARSGWAASLYLQVLDQ